MSKSGVTVYDLLVSCPNDVKSFIPVINEVVENFNRFLGDSNNIRVSIKNWASDTFPQSGNSPQELINSQLVDKCDALLAIFWSRFGTPTNNYDSGTEEEIIRVINAKKQVFLYFLDKSIPPSAIDTTQLDKLVGFKKKYKGLYCEIKDEAEFQKLFNNHLTQYFISDVIPGNFKKLQSTLLIKDLYSLSQDEMKLQIRNTKNNQNYSKMKQEFLTKIKEISEIKVSNQTKEPNKNNDNVVSILPNSVQANLVLSQAFEMYSKQYKRIEFDPEKIEFIISATKAMDINIPNNFWNLGDLKKDNFHINSIFNSSPLLEGSEEEKNKYNLLENLYTELEKFIAYKNYFSEMNKYNFIEGFITNQGTTFDEEIEVKLIFPPNTILPIRQMPIPSSWIISGFDDEMITYLFTTEESDSIEQFEYDWRLNTGQFTPPPIFGQKSYETKKEEFFSKIENVFFYKYFFTESNDILKFEISHLNHNKSVSFPSKILFKSNPKSFEYEIRSKHYPDIQKRTISIV
ncbi:MAG: hypothetical protein VB013_06310 [Anaerolineaceae bacterium]|nr:hypothetical protein [Anaerolineaceae bacterium]